MNKQPYRFILSGRKLLLCVYRPSETPGIELGIDLGAVMLNFYAVYQEYINITKRIREAVDSLETLVDDRKWPLPKYREMLFIY